MHVGSCSAGVVGTDKFVFDCFGSEINLTARLESSGVPSYCHMLKSDAEILRTYFGNYLEWDANPRVVNMKGIGEAETCLLANVISPDGDENSSEHVGANSAFGDSTNTFGESIKNASRRSRSSATNKTAAIANTSKPEQVYVQTSRESTDQIEKKRELLKKKFCLHLLQNQTHVNHLHSP
jgi:hypothetical protein